jgi:guanylate cyclase
MSTLIRDRALAVRIRSTISRIGADPGDSEDLRLEKTLMVSVSLMIIAASFLWSAMYFAFGEPVAGAIPLSYAIISSLSIGILALTGEYRFYRFLQLALILLLPFFLMVALGGFVNSSAVILWSLLCPFGALVFSDLKQASRWFLAYCALVVISGFLQPYVRSLNNLPTTITILFFVMNILAVSSIAFILLYYFVGQKNKFYSQLQLEQEKSEELLLNILPKDIADILKVENRIIADHFESATILFADLVGFTKLTSEMAPIELVELLNDIYSQFDRLVEKYGLEKIRTIGDNYMAVSGVPNSRADHAQAMAEMALDMSKYLAKKQTSSGKPIQFRIGINSGSLIAGIVGKKKFQYDVWGDAVNIASRMESHGVPGKIQITQTTYKLIEDKFICDPRGTVELKGKGQMATWFLRGVKETQTSASGVTAIGS